MQNYLSNKILINGLSIPIENFLIDTIKAMPDGTIFTLSDLLGNADYQGYINQLGIEFRDFLIDYQGVKEIGENPMKYQKIGTVKKWSELFERCVAVGKPKK